MNSIEKIIIAFIYFIPIVLSAQNLNIIIHTDTLTHTKSYTCNTANAEYKIEVYLNDINKGIIRYRFTGYIPLKDQLPVLNELFKKVFENNHQIIFHTLAWGRLNDDSNKDYTLARRLAHAAFESELWNSVTGKSFNGNTNAFVKSLANQADIFPELKELFAPFGYSINISSVEKVLVLPVMQLPFHESLPADIPVDARLPFDCQTWFSLTPVSPE